MSQDEKAQYLYDHFKLGRYLGPSIDVGPTMVAKIFTRNGQVLHHSTYQTLAKEEWGSKGKRG